MKAGVILLAGGSSRRFGSDKRRARFGDGRELLNACIDGIAASGLPILVCLGSGDRELAAALAMRRIPCIICPNSAAGMGNTLADGIAAVPESWDGALIALGDMPLVRPDTYSCVARGLAPGKIIVPHCAGVKGHPVGFHRVFFRELRQLCGDTGARDIVAAHPAEAVALAVDDPGIHADVDVPGDLAVLERQLREISR